MCVFLQLATSIFIRRVCKDLFHVIKCERKFCDFFQKTAYREQLCWPLWSCVGLYVVSQRASRVSYRNSRILSVRMNDTLVNHTTVWIIYIVSQRIAYKIRKI